MISCRPSFRVRWLSHWGPIKLIGDLKLYEAIGQNRTYHGGFTKVEMKNKAQSGEKLFTICEMRHQAPKISEMIERTKYVPNIKKGEAIIFATRALFLRTLEVTPEGKEY